jgi:dienelactone hydrolase
MRPISSANEQQDALGHGEGVADQIESDPYSIEEKSLSGKSRPCYASVVLIVAGVCLVLAACASEPLVPYSTDTPPLVLAPAALAGVVDKRARFREIYCAVLEARSELPDHRRCEEALTRVGEEPAGTGRPVDLGPSKRRLVAAVVPGLGFDCVKQWLEPKETAAAHVRQYGYDQVVVKVDALSSTANNARQIRDALLAIPAEPGPARLVLIGYSKGAPDILTALVTYPEIRSRVAAVVSAAGAVGGSPLANDAEQYQADMLRHFPGATCESGDGGAVADLRPATRRAWVAANPLPTGVRYYSLVTFPQPERISSIAKSSYRKLARVDSRNDSQVIFYDQVIPGSDLMAYLNADHWAIALPIARSHPTIGTMFVTQNAYPREALLEALLRFVEEDLSSDNGAG